MKRTQIYLSPEQYEFLENIAFISSKKEHKRISISEIIRKAINQFKEQYIRNNAEDKDLLSMRTYPSASLKDLWDNEKDSVYDEL